MNPHHHVSEYFAGFSSALFQAQFYFCVGCGKAVIRSCTEYTGQTVIVSVLSLQHGQRHNLL